MHAEKPKATILTQFNTQYSGDTGLADSLSRRAASLTFNGIPHLGAGLLYSELTKAGFDTQIKPLTEPEIARVGNENGSLVFMSAIDRGTDILVQAIKDYPGLAGRSIMGGQGISPVARELAQDHPEFAFYDGRADLDTQRLVDIYRAGGLSGYFINTNTVNLAQNDSHPSNDPKYSFRNLKWFSNSRIKPIESVTGCTQKCRFCPIAGEDITKKSIDSMIKETELMGYRANDILLFVDHNMFNRTKSELMEIFNYLNSKHIYWAGEGTISQVYHDRELLKVMGKNCISFLSGLEDIEGNMEGAPAKEILVKNFSQVLSAVRKAKFPVTWSMVLGLDSHTPMTFINTARFIEEHNLDVNLHLIQPRNGSLFQKQLISEGRMLSTDSRDRDGVHLVYKPKLMSYEEAISGTIWLKNFVARTANDRFKKNVAIGGMRYATALFGIAKLADGLSSGRMMRLNPNLKKEIDHYEALYRKSKI